ncbi:MAG: sulfotransferase [Sphingomonas taxi]
MLLSISAMPADPSPPSPALAFDAVIAAAQAHGEAGRWLAAVAALERAVALRPGAAGAWRGLGDARRAAGDAAGGSEAHAQAARLALAQPPLAQAVAAIAANRLASAEEIVRTRLRGAPTDVAAITLLGELAGRAGNTADALRFLRHALTLAPTYRPARERLARLLYAEHHLAEALAEFDRLLAEDPTHRGCRNLRAVILDLLGDQGGAIAGWQAMLADDPDQPAVWMTLGNALKSTGDIAGAVAAFRRALALAPHHGESWWGLANLKSFRFTADEVATMEAQAARPDLADADRLCLDFALGKAHEDAGRYADSFARYAAGNRRQQAQAPHDPEALGVLTRRCAALFTPAFFAARAEHGDPTPGPIPTPIFVVGLPRSGSTLVEQILASHPLVEGTMELPELPRIVRSLGGFGRDPARDPYPDTLAHLSPAQCAALGARYLSGAARWRQGTQPFFVDKLPLNFVSVGLIRLILPNAKIIDVRRDPLGCGLSVFKQYFAGGSPFATDLGHIGRFYADYVAMMELWDERLPGHVHPLRYEDLVTDTEATVRAMLAYLDLPFDPACLAPHANARAVRTPSAEQVRRPIHAQALDHWRHYEPWLGPLKAGLGERLAGG